jgi:hypothetical protein
VPYTRTRVSVHAGQEAGQKVRREKLICMASEGEGDKNICSASEGEVYTNTTVCVVYSFLVVFRKRRIGAAYRYVFQEIPIYFTPDKLRVYHLFPIIPHDNH